ncbi:TPA: methylmalonyl-CoA epimerase [Thermoplasmata archaeon]|nr:methylmalonyl-CoA epimerase [Thermoplasmata archaeon]
MRRIDHIGIAVEDLEAALKPYVEGLGLRVEHTEEVPTERVRVAMLPVGETNIELLQPTDPESAIAKFIDKRGPGVHHIALSVEDVSASIGSLKRAGVRLIDEQPRPGAGGTRVAFVHPKGLSGVLVELVEGGHH